MKSETVEAAKLKRMIESSVPFDQMLEELHGEEMQPDGAAPHPVVVIRVNGTDFRLAGMDRRGDVVYLIGEPFSASPTER